ncbi:MULTISPECIES: F-type conjugal transfer protein TrbB [Pantoea]|uniref:F-type conjugal transfer protein TrbB n=1 Tax=Pantoea TaxID=53335 RepID=UPI001045F0FF|nr:MULTISPECIES: F-type conjugal transfer protein TrbB [Pantoea]MBD8133168.1 F-type conjugal transfer protein TrbB [Pantoea agglomerans]MCW0977005.1 F-type conjugal transfer protein TrbB [Pantoea sp. JV6]TCZ22314.1 conjugal transfer protein TrbB [Pantoea agglomerans]TKK16128.1 conjugal transfer protein TrbB [Pantoea agglomerans]
MRLNVLLTALLLQLPALAQASVASDIAALEQAKAQRGAQLPDFGLPGASLVRAAPVKPPRMMTLTDGRQVNLNDYAVVVFMQRGCQYSAKFDPLLKSWADEEGIKVYPYSLDGYGDAAFPVALIPRKAGPNEPIAGEILTFFGNGLPIATPTTFMVNVNTNVAYPLFQGETDMGTMSQRLAQMIEADIDNLPPDTLGPVPSSASLTPQ